MLDAQMHTTSAKIVEKVYDIYKVVIAKIKDT